jgi:hypothetical protein
LGKIDLGKYARYRKNSNKITENVDKHRKGPKKDSKTEAAYCPFF